MTDTPTTEALIAKACPFCVSEFPPVLSRDKAGHIVICTGCSALGPTRRTPDEALTAWNARAGASGAREAHRHDHFRLMGTARQPTDLVAYATELETLINGAFRQADQWRYIANEMGYEPNSHKHAPLGKWLQDRIAKFRRDAALTRSEADEAPGVQG